ncbi:putative ATPase, archaeal AAA+ ATPase superfamily [Nostoc flagelliforme CCNUN1]|uniref:Putative ATPase, archaeal AAA+ ATPase superfamily n=1 Tax=Nostoc flagelliforme CCNUN1 TaxID=2038116 RepID=A0A2K8SJI9_9NOSO|nr:hypothetical protein [Nostoc flagelliforme]AUB35463.1 putative ATPase, archaeal AAA+ ATPase superfamily [Nostoc flagelliforme CCNUN1]
MGFKLHADYVNCVLLNACHSEKTAIAISQYINYAIGMNQPIEDKAAIEFAKGFYDGLGYKNSGNQNLFQRAFDEGIVAIQLSGISENLTPVLLKTDDLRSDSRVDYTRLRDLLRVVGLTHCTNFLSCALTKIRRFRL